MNLPRVVILVHTCQVSDTLIFEMLIAYAVVAGATNFQCPVLHKRLNLVRMTDSSLEICICNHMLLGIHHVYVTQLWVSFG